MGLAYGTNILEESEKPYMTLFFLDKYEEHAASEKYGKPMI